MIQCESCDVWQHCECIGISRKNTPKHYYCEECRPINHTVYRLGILKNQAPPRASVATGANSSTSSSTSSRSNSSAGATAVGPSPRKRNTNNSREAALFPAASSRRANSPQTDLQNSPEENVATKGKRGSQDENPETTTTTKRKRSNDTTDRNAHSGASTSPAPETDTPGNQSPQNPTAESSNNTESNVPAESDSISPTGTTTRRSKAASSKRKRDSAAGSAEPNLEPPQRRARFQEPSQDQANPDGPQQPESRPGTPSAAAPPVFTNLPTTSERTTNGKRVVNNNDISTITVEKPAKKGRKDTQTTRSAGNHRAAKSRRGNHNGHSGRGKKDTESSHTNGHRSRRERSTTPTFKSHEPNPRATIAEMKKRLKTISDYIARVQIVTAAQQMNRDGTRKSASKSPAISASSDDKVEVGAEGQPQIVENGMQVEETSMTVLDRLSYHIHLFQKRYGDRAGLDGGVASVNGASAVAVGN